MALGKLALFCATKRPICRGFSTSVEGVQGEAESRAGEQVIVGLGWLGRIWGWVAMILFTTDH